MKECLILLSEDDLKTIVEDIEAGACKAADHALDMERYGVSVEEERRRKILTYLNSKMEEK